MQHDEELGLVSSVMFYPKDLTHLAVTGYFEVDIIDSRYINAVRYDLIDQFNTSNTQQFFN